MAIFARDNFNAPNNTALLGYTSPMGNTWSAAPLTPTATAAIVNGGAYALGTAGTGSFLASGVPATASCSAWAAFRYLGQTATNTWGVQCMASTSADTAYSFVQNGTSLRLIRRLAAVGTVLVTGVNLAPTINETYLFGLVPVVTASAALSAYVQRLSDLKWFTSAGAWQSTQVAFTTFTDSTTPILAAGLAGIFCQQGDGLTTGAPCVVWPPTASAILAYDSTPTAIATPWVLPSNHTGAISVVVTGVGGTSFSGSSVITKSGTTGWSVGSPSGVGAATYTVALTGPVAATPPAGATGTISLTESVTGSTVAALFVKTPSITISPTLWFTNTTPTIAVSGFNTLFTSDTPTTMLGVSGGTGASPGTATVSGDFALTFALTTGSTAASEVITHVPTGATATETITALVAVNDANWGWSQGNWKINGSTDASTTDADAHFVLSLTSVPASASATLLVDVSALVAGSATSAEYPILQVSLDNGQQSETILTSATTQIVISPSLAAGAHVVKARVRMITSLIDRYTTPSSVLKIIGLAVSGSGASLVAPTYLPNQMVIFSDSNGEGYLNTANTTNEQLNEDATAAFPALIAAGWGAEYSNISKAGIGWLRNGNGNVPALPTSWNQYYSGATRSWGSRTVTDVLIQMGTNDGSHSLDPTATTAAIVAWLPTVRSTFATANIWVWVPPGGWMEAAIMSAVASYKSSSNDAKAYLIDLGVATQAGINGTGASYQSFDGIHYTLRTHANLASMAVAAMKAALSGTGGGRRSILTGGSL